MGTCPTRCRSNMTILENPPDPAAPQEIFVSLCDYPSFRSTQLTMCIGERLTVVSDDGDFLLVRSTATHRQSYIPTNYAAKVTHGWLFTGINRYKAEELLLQPNNHNGAFMIRESETKKDCYSLSVLWTTNSSCLDCVKHYCISRLPNGRVYISPELTFSSLQRLVQHYSESADGLCGRLTDPCFIQGLDDPGEDRNVTAANRRTTVNWKDITRSMIFRRKGTRPDSTLVSEGLREAISSYLQMTDSSDHMWDS